MYVACRRKRNGEKQLPRIYCCGVAQKCCLLLGPADLRSSQKGKGRREKGVQKKERERREKGGQKMKGKKRERGSKKERKEVREKEK